MFQPAWFLDPSSPMVDAGLDFGQDFCGAPDRGGLEHCP